MEIGGFIELDTYRLPMLHGDALKLNCGRNALWYLIKVHGIKTIWMPKFLCNSCYDVLKKENVQVKYYAISFDFKPRDIKPSDDEWLYVVNYYGQLSNDYISNLKQMYPKLILDNAQAYFQMPVNGVDTLYTCRKFFGVPDGAILYTDVALNEELTQDVSFERMHFLLGRYERNASEFYSEYVDNNHIFADEPIRKMSKLTNNLLHAIDYEAVKQQRTENFALLNEYLKEINILSVHEIQGAFMYPLMVDNAQKIKHELVQKRIYIPTLWPNVLEECEEDRLEWKLAHDVLPLPVDQRYSMSDMEHLVKEVLQCIY